MELTNWVWPWLALFCKTKLVRQASCWLTEWCHQLNSRGATKARKWNFNFLLMLNDSLSYGLWPLCSSGQSILLLFLWTAINHSHLPLFPLTPTPTPHLIKAPPKGLFSIVNGQRTKALFFLPPPTCQDFTFILGSTRFALKQKQTTKQWWRKSHSDFRAPL